MIGPITEDAAAMEDLFDAQPAAMTLDPVADFDADALFGQAVDESVADNLFDPEALGDLAAYYRRRHRTGVVAITGSALTNHTMPHLLGLCDPKAYVLALGDSVPMSAILFDYGLSAVCGSMVVEPDLAMQCVSQGDNFRQIQCVKRLTMTR